MPHDLPDPELFVGTTIPRFPEYKIVEHIGSGSNGRVFRAHNETTGSNFAFKIVPIANIRYSEYLEEAKKANLLENAAVVRHYDTVQGVICGVECVVFVCDYVDGMTLRDYIRRQRDDVDVSFIEDFLRLILGLLHELKARGMTHGDLHAGNILVARSRYDIYERVTFRITDFGVGRATDTTAHSSDFLYVAEILRQLLLCVEYRDCEGRDRYVYEVLRQDFLKRHLIETNILADEFASDPQRMVEKLDSLDGRYREEVRRDRDVKMVTPFDYPNCEQIGNHHLLLQALYSDRILGLTEIGARSNVVLTGPRGCGKSTVFRVLSLDYLISTDNDDPSDVRYVGIYYGCDDLYFAFPRYKRANRERAVNLPMHFLTATLLATTLEQVVRWARRKFPRELEAKEERLVRGLWEVTGLKPPDSPSAHTVGALIGRLKQRERKRPVEKQRFLGDPAQNIGSYFGPEVLLRACEVLRSTLSFLDGRPFYFFIDDYSHPKITMELQSNLNRLLMTRSADLFFKLATESPVSFSREDVDGKRFVETREYDLVNLGLKFLTDESARRPMFIDDLFRRRFNEVQDYPVRSLEELLGSQPRNETAVATAIRDGEPEQQYYAGCETITAMCSGDIHYIIRLVSRIVEDCGGVEWLTKSREEPKIDPRRQNNSIRAAAGAFMESVRVVPKWGPKLAEIVTAFGNVAHSYIKYETSSNNTGRPPHQASRMEPYEALRLSTESEELLHELLRYSVFIEDPRGKSRRGEIVPRFYLRRYLIPHLRLTFSLRDSLQLENHEIEMLLTDPRGFERRARLKSAEDAERRRRRRESGGTDAGGRQGDFWK